jgi:hypothetical protein
VEAHSVERKLAAIFAPDVAGYSALMGRDKVGTLRALNAYRVIIDRLVALHREVTRPEIGIPTRRGRRIRFHRPLG